MLALAFEVSKEPTTDDPIGTALRFVSQVRVRPSGGDELFAADDVREVPIHRPDLVGRLQPVTAAHTQVDDTRHARQGTR